MRSGLKWMTCLPLTARSGFGLQPRPMSVPMALWQPVSVMMLMALVGICFDVSGSHYQ